MENPPKPKHLPVLDHSYALGSHLCVARYPRKARQISEKFSKRQWVLSKNAVFWSKIKGGYFTATAFFSSMTEIYPKNK